MTIVARRAFPPNTLQELIDYTAKQGNKITCANAGAGTASHMMLIYLIYAGSIGVPPISSTRYRRTPAPAIFPLNFHPAFGWRPISVRPNFLACSSCNPTDPHR